MPTRRPHPLRHALYNEVHARPYERMQAPLAVPHFAFVCDANGREAERAHLEALLRDLRLPVPASDASHLSIDLPGCRLRWERHTEFVAYTVWRALKPGELLDAAPAHRSLPADWLAAIPGQLLVASHGLVLTPNGPNGRTVRELADDWLDPDTLIGADIADGDLHVFSDLRLHPDGYGRWLLGVRNPAMSRRRLGRYVQRLLEIDTYRMMALLGLPAAREVTRRLDELERQLAQLADAGHGSSLEEETALLDALTRLAREIEGAYAKHHGRFSASSAYFALVEQRIDELREERIEGMQTIREFVDRRLKPAVTTTAWASRRLGALSERVSRASELLRTRVEIEQQQHAREMLSSMNRRQQLQLRLQAAVEGLSVAAITYYGAGLVGYLAKGLYAAKLAVPVELVVAASVPLIAISAWAGMRSLRRRIEG